MSETSPSLNSGFSGVDFLTLASFILIIGFPALKTFSALVVDEKPALAFQMKWSYYWISLPYVLITYKILEIFLKKYFWFHMMSFLMSAVLSFNNGFIIRQMTVYITSKFYKSHYKTIKKIPQMFSKAFAQIPKLILSAFTGGEQQQEPARPNVHLKRRPKTYA